MQFTPRGLAESMGSASPVLYGIVKRFFRTVQENTKAYMFTRNLNNKLCWIALVSFWGERNVPHSYQKVCFVTWQIIMQIHHWRSFNELMYANLHDLLFRFFFIIIIWLVIWLFMDTEIKWTISFSFLLEVISWEI